MKITYLTDIHDALKELRLLLSGTQSDLYLLSGDIIYKAFYEEEKIYNFVCLQEELYQISRHLGKNIYPMDLALDILRFPKKFASKNLPSETLEKKAQLYRELFEIAAKTMKEKYSLIRELIDKYSNAPTWLLPGNYDIDFRYTALKEHNLHCKLMYKRGLKFSGYGGAPVQTSGIPEKLAVSYHEKEKKGVLYSEPLEFFQESQPDVLVLHNPAYGYFDCIPGLGHVGSHGIRAYLDEHNPILVLSGHVHEDYGIAKRNETIFLNPSNFGGVDSPQGWQKGGSYAEIHINNKRLEQIHFMQLADDHIFPILKVFNSERGLLGEVDKTYNGHSSLDPNLLIRANNGALLG